MASNRNLLRRPKSTEIPTRWLAVCRDGDDTLYRQWQLDKSGALERCIQAEWPTKDVLAHLCKSIYSGESYWCVGWRMYPWLCAARLYDYIEAGDITLSVDVTGGDQVDSRRTGRRLTGALICSDPPTIIDCKTSKGGKIKFIDLANLGLSQEQFDATKTQWDLDAVVQAIEDYITLVKQYGLGKLKETAASQGWYGYRRAHMDCELVPHSNGEVRSLERAAYYGGRCEALQLGKLPGHVYHLDVRSMYASIGLQAEFPVRLIHYDTDIASGGDSTWPDGCDVIARVVIDARHALAPLRTHGVTLYPAGRFETVLCGPEFALADELGMVAEIKDYAVYEMAPIFKEFSQWYFYALDALDRDGLGHLKPTLKQIVNSTFGKIGQRSKQWRTDDTYKCHARWEMFWRRHPKLGAFTCWRTVDGVTQYLDEGQESPTSMPAISAWMCSLARVRLYELIGCAGQENVFYYDTDSLMVNRAGYDHLLAAGHAGGDAPGQLTLREESDEVTIFGIKHYVFGGRLCCAGYSQAGSADMVGGATRNEHERFDYGLYHRYAFGNRTFVKCFGKRKPYRHGYVADDGRVYPWIIEENASGQLPAGASRTPGDRWRIVGNTSTDARKSHVVDNLHGA